MHKTLLQTFASIAFAGLIMGAAPVATGQATVVTTTTSGTVAEFSPDTIVVRTESTPAPVRYAYSKTTTYVDENGAPVSNESVKSGLPVTVYYTKDGDRLIASKVIVRKAALLIEEKTTTTTTTTTEKK